MRNLYTPINSVLNLAIEQPLEFLLSLKYLTPCEEVTTLFFNLICGL